MLLYTTCVCNIYSLMVIFYLEISEYLLVHRRVQVYVHSVGVLKLNTLVEVLSLVD